MSIFKNFKGTKLFFTISLFCLLCNSCSTEFAGSELIDNNPEELYSKYNELSQKQVTSILDVALGNATLSRGEVCILGFTEEDVNYLNSLDANGLVELKKQLMKKWNFNSDDDIENMLDSTYYELCKSMSDEELITFNQFLCDYIEMPQGVSSIDKLNVIQTNTANPNFNNLCLYAAIGIDNFGRGLFDTTQSSRTTADECKKNFGIRIAITSIGTIAGMLIPGPGWAVAAAAVCDAVGAAADYANCIKHTN